MDQIWRACADLCLDAIAAGSLGIAAVIVDHGGRIVSKGRNQLFDTLDSPNIIKNTLVSHAEVNALAGIAEGQRRDRTLMMYTTVEPCPMCMGAISMSLVRHIIIGSRDGNAGATDLAETHPFIRRKKLKIEFMQGKSERFFASLHAYALVHLDQVPLSHPFFEEFQAHYPDLLPAVLSLKGDPDLINAIRGHDRQRIEELFQV